MVVMARWERAVECQQRPVYVHSREKASSLSLTFPVGPNITSYLLAAADLEHAWMKKYVSPPSTFPHCRRSLGGPPQIHQGDLQDPAAHIICGIQKQLTGTSTSRRKIQWGRSTGKVSSLHRFPCKSHFPRCSCIRGTVWMCHGTHNFPFSCPSSPRKNGKSISYVGGDSGLG